MPPTIISIDATVFGPIHSFFGSGDELQIAAGTTIVTTSSAIMWYGGGLNLATIYGSLSSGGSVTVQGNGSSLTIETGGQLTLTSTQQHTVALAAGAGGTVFNHGTISASDTFAAGLYDNGLMLNTGSITAAGAFAIIASANGRLTNSGTITATGFSVAMPDYYSAGIIILGDRATFYNMAGGVVRANNSLGVGVEILAFSGNTIQNHGRIVSDGNAGVDLSNVYNWSGASNLLNRGEIIGGNGISYHGSQFADLVTNRGSMTGDVTMGSGNDTIDNRAGTITGDLYGGAGDDYYIGHLGTTVTGTVFGGAGNDTLFGGDNADRLEGEDDNDLIQGGGGDDSLFGGAGADTLAGQAGNDGFYGGSGNDLMSGGAGSDTLDGGVDNDTLLGNEGNDALYGGDGNDNLAGHDGDDLINGGTGNDLLTGGAGNDTLSGGEGYDLLYGQDGDDVLNGGGGGDRLYGGAGADLFDFDDAAATPASVSGRAWIMDFTPGEDRIDLSQIDADSVSDGHQSFTYIATAAFSGIAGELRYDRATWLVTGDTDGDGVADFSIVLAHGPMGVTAADFILV
ncbi:calcium-binding protein [Pseudogemmobacter bohemicus]|uniref:calcium-binding protein n=1 Tax=Pseudogemmobacter bohemicus TaxID=2250708 RepID=UPI000DD36B33|nr:calcium-binding protein [Pseudogemmobacter bohemicus]